MLAGVSGSGLPLLVAQVFNLCVFPVRIALAPHRLHLRVRKGEQPDRSCWRRSRTAARGPLDVPQLDGIERLMRLYAELLVFLPKTQADGVGFEPTSRLRDCRFSRPVHSTALPPIPIGRGLRAPATAEKSIGSPRPVGWL